MEKIKRIEQYLFDFFSTRFENYDAFYRSVYRARELEIYKLERGPELMDLIIISIVQFRERLFFKQLVPPDFATPRCINLWIEKI